MTEQQALEMAARYRALPSVYMASVICCGVKWLVVVWWKDRKANPDPDIKREYRPV